MSTLMDFASNIANGKTKVVDLTHTLDPDFPVIILPPEFGQCARFRMEEISCYDHRGPAWKWYNISMSEHTGTHFDAPAHWISGRDLPIATVDEIDVKNFIGPICVIDCSDGANQNDDFELTVDIIKDWEAIHGTIPPQHLGFHAHGLVKKKGHGISEHERGWSTFPRTHARGRQIFS